MRPAPGPSNVEAWVRDALAPLHLEDLHVELICDCLYMHGQAQCYETKRRASALAQAVFPGDIANELRVARADFDDDETIARAIRAALAALGSDIDARVTIAVSDGMARLSGTAVDRDERQAIEAAAWQAAPVRGVRNEIAVANDLGDAEVAAALSAYARRAMHLQHAPVTVDYSKGTARLSGTVATRGEARAIEDLIRWHDRVEEVVNELRIAAPPATSSIAR